MDLGQMSVNGLLSMHAGVRTSLAADDAMPDGAKIYGVRENPDWRIWSDSLEAELTRRGETFTAISW